MSGLTSAHAAAAHLLLVLPTIRGALWALARAGFACPREAGLWLDLAWAASALVAAASGQMSLDDLSATRAGAPAPGTHPALGNLAVWVVLLAVSTRTLHRLRVRRGSAKAPFLLAARAGLVAAAGACAMAGLSGGELVHALRWSAN